MVADIEELEKLDASENRARKAQRKGNTNAEKWSKFMFSNRGRYSIIVLERLWNPKIAEARNDFRSIGGDFIYRHPVEPRVQLYVPEGRNITNTTDVH